MQTVWQPAQPSGLQIYYSANDLSSHNLPPDIARELFKPS